MTTPHWQTYICMIAESDQKRSLYKKIMKQRSHYSPKNIPIFNIITLTMHKKCLKKWICCYRPSSLHQTFTVAEDIYTAEMYS
jgi:hypothetical protein